MTKSIKNPKPYYFKNNEFISEIDQTKVKKEVIDELIAISKESSKLEEKLLKKRAENVKSLF